MFKGQLKIGQLVKHGSSLYLVDAAEGFTLEQTDDMSGRERLESFHAMITTDICDITEFPHWSFSNNPFLVYPVLYFFESVTGGIKYRLIEINEEEYQRIIRKNGKWFTGGKLVYKFYDPVSNNIYSDDFQRSNQ